MSSQNGARWVPQRVHFGRPKNCFFYFLGIPKGSPPRAAPDPPLREKGPPARSIRHFFRKSATRPVPWGGAWAPQKSPWKIILALFWGPKVGPSGVPKCQENEVGKNRKNEIFENFEGLRVYASHAEILPSGWGGFPLRSSPCGSPCGSRSPNPCRNRPGNLA